MLTKDSSAETDLGPRRVGTHFRKLACRSDPVDEVLTAGGSTVWTSAPGHDRQALLMSRTVRLGRFVFSAALGRRYGTQAGFPEARDSTQWFSRTRSRSHGTDDTKRRPNKALKLTSAEHIERSQLNASVGPTVASA